MVATIADEDPRTNSILQTYMCIMYKEPSIINYNQHGMQSKYYSIHSELYTIQHAHVKTSHKYYESYKWMLLCV